MELSDYLKKNKASILNLGCGKKNPEESFGVDILNFKCVDLVHDLNKGIPLPDNTFKLVIGFDFLEHLKPESSIKIMEEIYRVTKPGGQFRFKVPSTDGNNMGAFQDPTHFSFWNEKKFWYFMDDEFGSGFRSIYNIKCRFKPMRIETYYNEHNVTYVRGIMIKPTTKISKNSK